MFEIESDFFEFVLKILKITGLYTDENSSTFYRVLSVIHLIFVFPLLFFEWAYVIVAPEGTFNAIKCAGIASFRLLSVIRIVHFLLRKNIYNDIRKSLKRESFQLDHFYFDILKNAKTLTHHQYDYRTNYQKLKRIWCNCKLEKQNENQCHKIKVGSCNGKGNDIKGNNGVNNEAKKEEMLNIFNKTTMKYKLMSYVMFTFLTCGGIISLLASYLRVFIKPTKLIYDSNLNRYLVVNELPYRLLIPFVDMTNLKHYTYVMYYELYAICFWSFDFLCKYVHSKF